MRPASAPAPVRLERALSVRRLAAAGGLVTLVASLALIASARSGGETPRALVFATGGVAGYLDQCGCTRFPMGGVDRRMGQMTSVRRKTPAAHALALDAGNFADSPGPAGEVKTLGLVRAMNRMGYIAVGVGERELLFGPEFLEHVFDEARFPFISSNLVREKTREPWLAPFTTYMAGSLSVAILSVTRHNPASRMVLADGDAVVSVDPAAALLKHVPPARADHDLIVLLTALPIEQARVLARRVPGIDLILGAHGGVFTTDPVIEGRTRILYLGDEGKYLAQVSLFRAGEKGPVSMESVLYSLIESVPADPELNELMVETMARAAETDRAVRADAPAAAESARRAYVGHGACSSCHAGIVQEWVRTGHARAYETVVRAEHFEPSCVSCHVTGYGQAGGFVDLDTTPHLKAVGCESCHGPGADHIRYPERPYGKITLATCTSCHTLEMDRDFDYYGDLQLVRHASPER